MSSIPWRKAGVKYAQNEIYFDIIEEIDATIEANGAIVSCEAHGNVNVNCRLSGMPDLGLNFINHRILDDVSFHPCVRYQKWESDKILSFVPPDGHFSLMSYRVNLPGQQILPLQVKPQFYNTGNGGKFDISINPRSTDGKPIEKVVVTIPMTKSATTVNATCNVGQYMYDPVTKSIKWEISKIQIRDRTPMLSGTYSSRYEHIELMCDIAAMYFVSDQLFYSSAAHDTGTTISLQFQISMFAVSGLKVDTLRLYREGYKPYKGVRSVTKAGKFQIRA
ncbi:hypothetical protein NQZ79_g772 [Umbelopsis isabellina]|nr:hypothetical protein NQZ79_g772 [Umbelopsis isabellina]